MPHHADRIVSLYDRYARIWDGDRQKTLFERPWLDRFLALLPAGGAVLDIGCGSGEPIARYLIDAGHGVTGVDSSPAMIELCWDRFPQETWLVADMRSLSLDRQFDGVLAWDSFFHLRPDDQRAMFPIFRAHAKPKAALMFTSGPRAGEAMGSYQGEPLYHASLAPDDYRTLLDGRGFDVAAQVSEDAAAGGRTVWLARRR